VTLSFDRRKVLASMGALGLMPQRAWAEDITNLAWKDLVPDDGPAAIPPFFQGLDHDRSPLLNEQPASNGVRTDWNGQVVRLPGFIVPIDYSGEGVTAFILVPFVGACVHVPPPPANQDRIEPYNV